MLPFAIYTLTPVPSYEFSLVIFTVLSQLSIGLSMVGLMFSRAICQGVILHRSQEHGPSFFMKHSRRLLCLWSSNVVIMAVALGASLFHLGYPLEAYKALTNLQGAWLSREILAFGLYFGLMLVTLIAFILKKRSYTNSAHNEAVPNAPKLIYELASILTVAVGVIALITSGVAYAPPAQTAINNILPLLFFSITTLGLGFAVGLCFLPQMSFTRPQASTDSQVAPVNAHQKLYRGLACICAASLLVGLVVYFIIPCVWLSGGTVMQMTAAEWLASPWFWGHMLLTFLWPLLILWRCARMPQWLPLVMVVGAFMGRMAFFADTISTSILMGYPF